MDVLEEIRFHMQVAVDARRTLLCAPDQVPAVQAAVDKLDVAGTFTVKASPVCPAGKILVLDEQALDASMNQAFQRAGQGIRLRGQGN